VSYDGTLPLVRADAGQLQRVLVNVLENAVKFSPPNEQVRVTARSATGRVHVSVSDHGPGIPESDLSQIFRPFFRGRSATPGSGLGLAIAHGLAAANGSSLTVEPASKAGAIFTLSIPAPAAVQRRRA
jgi:two-component system sensor histidine kinase KdpD